MYPFSYSEAHNGRLTRDQMLPLRQFRKWVARCEQSQNVSGKGWKRVLLTHLATLAWCARTKLPVAEKSPSIPARKGWLISDVCHNCSRANGAMSYHEGFSCQPRPGLTPVTRLFVHHYHILEQELVATFSPQGIEKDGGILIRDLRHPWAVQICCLVGRISPPGQTATCDAASASVVLGKINELDVTSLGQVGLPVGTAGKRLGLLRRSRFLLAISAFRMRSSLFW